MKLVYGDVAMSAWTSYRVCGLFMDVVQTNNGIYRNCSLVRALEMVPQHLSTFDSVEQSLKS